MIYTLGLLHDIGFMAEEEFMPEAFEDMMTNYHKDTPICEHELHFFGYNHTKVGAAIAESFSFPILLTKVIQHHHEPSLNETDLACYSSIIHIANHTCNINQIGFCSPTGKDVSTYNDCLAYHDVTPEALEVLLEDVTTELTELEKDGGLQAS